VSIYSRRVISAGGRIVIAGGSRIEVFDASGVSLGFVPVYDAIT